MVSLFYSTFKDALARKFMNSNTIFNYLEYAESNGVLVLSAYRVKFDEIGAQSSYFLTWALMGLW